MRSWLEIPLWNREQFEQRPHDVTEMLVLKLSVLDIELGFSWSPACLPGTVPQNHRPNHTPACPGPGPGCPECPWLHGSEADPPSWGWQHFIVSCQHRLCLQSWEFSFAAGWSWSNWKLWIDSVAWFVSTAAPFCHCLHTQLGMCTLQVRLKTNPVGPPLCPAPKCTRTQSAQQSLAKKEKAKGRMFWLAVRS